jgi:hypothetical protein
MLFKVKVRATGVERTVTAQAYAAKGPKFYEKLGTVTGDGKEITGAVVPNSQSPQVVRSVRAAVPVVVKEQIAAPEPELTPEPETKQEIVKERKKPGPKPRKESISSNSEADEK